MSARDLFARCLRVKPDDYVALTNWGLAETEYARILLGDQSPKAEATFKIALKKLEEALSIKADYYEG